MTNQINVIHLNNSPILYTKLVPTPTSHIGNKQYLQISKDNELHLIETIVILDKKYRGVTRDNKFWFLVEDLVELHQDSQERLRLIEKLLTNIPNQYKGFVCVVDARGDKEFVLAVSSEAPSLKMVSSKGLKDKLFKE